MWRQQGEPASRVTIPGPRGGRWGRGHWGIVVLVRGSPAGWLEVARGSPCYVCIIPTCCGDVGLCTCHSPSAPGTELCLRWPGQLATTSIVRPGGAWMPKQLAVGRMTAAKLARAAFIDRKGHHDPRLMTLQSTCTPHGAEMVSW
jgi:hypothetical protein